MGGGLKGEGFFFFLGRNLSEEVVDEASTETKNWSDIVPTSLGPAIAVTPRIPGCLGDRQGNGPDGRDNDL